MGDLGGKEADIYRRGVPGIDDDVVVKGSHLGAACPQAPETHFVNDLPAGLLKSRLFLKTDPA
jgi:hypothetical protein